ncbi:hypothetical protein AYR66_16875 [Noviherbaspirillum denitrificans]|uniref:Uncharacterized protein n=1 Tax=Noviherbaspirillum denitrificans TaxID=1968433 RepID=A0A254TED4_9BURK|nr:hypothetical protein AYR66_16875 [Noviherbaspirillum denitrificans]
MTPPAGSCGDVGDELHFQQCYVILQLEFALLQASQLEFVAQDITRQQFDHCVEIAMFHFQFDDSSLYLFRWNHDVVVEYGK